MRLAVLPGRPGKPTILVTKEYKIYLGNLTDEAVELTAGELFGFGTGAFEVKLISGSVVLRRLKSACLGCLC